MNETRPSSEHSSCSMISSKSHSTEDATELEAPVGERIVSWIRTPQVPEVAVGERIVSWIRTPQVPEVAVGERIVSWIRSPQVPGSQPSWYGTFYLASD